MPLELILPRSVADTRRYYRCFCGMAFPLDQKTQWVRHTNSCARRHEDEIGEAAERRKNNAFISPSDVEMYEHYRRGGT